MNTELPVCVKNSKIHGIGVFPETDVESGTLIGEVCRTKFIIPIISRFGSFVNHSDQASSKLIYFDGVYYAVSTKKLRRYKDEITLDYNALPWFLERKKHWYV